MKVVLGTDHAGYHLKEHIKAFLRSKDYEIIDEGAVAYQENDDYPDFIAKAARSVVGASGNVGIIFGKSGAGEAIVANKIKGIRAVVGFNKEAVLLARQHNDANVLSLGSGFVTEKEAEELVNLFLTTSFSNEERHRRRIEKITRLE